MSSDSSPLAQLLHGSPYSLSTEGLTAAWQSIRAVTDEVALLRAQGKLSAEVVEQYYGRTLFEQVAESNALVGSTLSVGETEAAVLKGITLTGHDPGYVRDAQSLYNALRRLAEMARANTPTNLATLQELHELILQDRRSAGQFRQQPVAIRGSAHRPPKTWSEIMDQMEHWEQWSLSRADAPAIVRAVVLHAWLAHIHPFLDGNGRLGRLLITFLLCERGVLDKPVLYLSHYFKTHRQEYYDRLQAVRDHGDWEAWLAFFLKGIVEVSAQAAETARRVLALREEHRSLIAERLGRAAGNGHRVLQHLYVRPILSAKEVQDLLGTTFAGANQIVKRLAELGILVEITGHARHRRFRYEPYVRLFDDAPAAAGL